MATSDPKKMLKRPSEIPPESPLETQNEPLEGGGTAARREDGAPVGEKSLQSAAKMHDEQSPHYQGVYDQPRSKFPLGNYPHKSDESSK
jgi:hypothetical protein